MLRRRRHALSAQNDHWQGFPSANQPNKGADRDLSPSIGPDSVRDALRATFVGDWEEPSGESRSIGVFAAGKKKWPVEIRLIFQTTLVHPLRPEFSVSGLFACAKFSEHTKIDTVLEALAIEPMSGGSISEPELKRIVAYILSDSHDVFEMNDRALGSFVNRSDIGTEFLDRSLNEKHLIVDGERPEREALFTLVNNSFGAALGVYSVPEEVQFRDTSGPPKIALLNLNLPHGVLIFGAKRGVDRALRFGLYEKICAWLTHQGAKARTAAVGDA